MMKTIKSLFLKKNGLYFLKIREKQENSQNFSEKKLENVEKNQKKGISCQFSYKILIIGLV